MSSSAGRFRPIAAHCARSPHDRAAALIRPRVESAAQIPPTRLCHMRSQRMRLMTYRTIALGFAMALLAAPSLAQTYSTDDERYRTQAERMQTAVRDDRVAVDALRDDYAAVANRRETRATKLSAADYQELSRQRREMNQLIKRMEAGQNVGAGEIDRALGIEYVD